MKIAIVGGGIGGLTLAAMLEQLGLGDYHVYEQALTFREVGAAISVWPNALRVMRNLGLIDTLRKTWGEIREAYVRASGGRVLATMRPAYDLPAVCMHRADLHAVIRSAVPAEKCSTDCRLDRYEETAQGVTLHFQSGASADADLLIGADGIRSAVRAQLVGDGPPVYRGYNVWRGVAALDLPQGYASETWGRGARVGVVPIRTGQVGWWATLNEPSANTTDGPEGAVAKLQRAFGNWHAPIPDLFRSSPAILKNALCDRPPTPGWSRGRVALIGDAAHPTTPNLGQGGAMAVEGACLLARSLHAYIGDPSRAFTRYEELHFPRAAGVVKESLRGGRMGQLENRLAVALRNVVVAATPSSVTARMLDKYFRYDVTAVAI